MISFSALIITHGREELLLKCLNSLRSPVENWQLILVANGLPLSEEVIEYAKSLTPDVEIINLSKKENPGRSRNSGLKLVKYDWVFLIDDDAYLLPRYFETAMPLLEKERIDILGGPDLPAKGMDQFSQALAIALSSPFCTGHTFARHQMKGKNLLPANETMLSSCNLWIRSRFLQDVQFPEDYLRTEETALLLDLESRGARMFYHSGLAVGHHRRKSIRELLSPTFYAGYFRSKVLREKSVKNGYLFWLPSIFVILHLIFFVSPEIFWAMARIYLGVIVMMSLNLAARRNKMRLFAEISFLHYLIVFLYGLGFLRHRLGFHGNK